MPLLKLLYENINDKLQKYIDLVKSNKNFKRWFKDSKVVDDDGDPLIVFHATTGDFDEFDKGDIGYHFGTSKAAVDRITRSRIIVDTNKFVQYVKNQIVPTKEEFEQQDFISFLDNLQDELDLSVYERNDIGAELFGVVKYMWEIDDIENMTDAEFFTYLPIAFAQQTSYEVRQILNINVIEEGSRTGAYFLSIKNPLIDVDDAGSWDDPLNVQDAIEAYIEEQFPNIDIDEFNDFQTFKELKEFLIKNGIDGIQYTNFHEDSGSESWIAFKPEQIKSIWNGGEFNPSSKKFNESIK